MDTLGFPSSTRANTRIFRATTGVTGQGLQSWQKPRGISMVFMFAVGGGGGGGGGFGNSTSSNRGGGAGGACSGITRFICPAILLPDIMYVQVGCGGPGGAGSTAAGAAGAGGTGCNSYVSGSKSVTSPNTMLQSGSNVPGGGSAGTAVGTVTGGTVPTVAIVQPINQLGIWMTLVGVVGGAGGVLGAAGPAITAWGLGSLLTSPGTGGASLALAANTTIAANGQTASAAWDMGSQGFATNGASALVPGGLTTGAPHGGAGIQRITPFFNTGGGGGAAVDGVAGNGGNGGFGCGGGGGGGGQTGGQGGNGGDGIVIISAW